MKSKRTLFFRVAAIVLLVVIAAIMMVIGRGHTVYLDNKTMEYEGESYSALYKVVASHNGEKFAKLYARERGMITCIGQKITIDLEITAEKGGVEETKTITLKLPYNMDGIIINLPAYLAGLPEEAYLSQFIPSPEEEAQEPDVSNPDDGFGGMEGMEGMESMEGMEGDPAPTP